MKTPVLESLLKRDSNIGFKKFLKTPIFKNICERLLLEKIGNILYHKMKTKIHRLEMGLFFTLM